MRESFRACALITLLLLAPASALAQAGAKAPEPSQDKGGQKAEAGPKSEGEPKQAEGDEKKCAAAVLLQAVLHSSGEVREIKVLKFTPEDFPTKDKDAFTLKAVESAGRLKFQPSQKDGRPVSQRLKLEYCFDLN